jgi:hypothetical protein
LQNMANLSKAQNIAILPRFFPINLPLTINY